MAAVICCYLTKNGKPITGAYMAYGSVSIGDYENRHANGAVLTHCGLVTPYGDIELDQHCLG